jgi:hypothetical protein
MADTTGTIETVALALSRLLAPLGEELAPGNARGFFAEIGIPLTSAQEASLSGPLSSTVGLTTDLTSLTSDLVAAIQGNNTPAILQKGLALAARSAQIIQGFVSLAGAVKALNIPGVPGNVIDGIPDRLFGFLLFRYLESATGANELFEFLGVLDRVDVNVDSTSPNQPPYTSLTFDFSTLGGWLSNPSNHLRSLFDWGNDAAFDGIKLLQKLQTVLLNLGLPVIFDTMAPPRLDLIFADISPKTDVVPKGFLIGLKTSLSSDPLSIVQDDWQVEFKSDFPFPLYTGVLIQPDGSVTIIPPSPTAMTGQILLQLTMQKTQPPGPIVFVGQTGGSRLEVQNINVRTAGQFAWDASSSKASADFTIGGGLQGAKLVIDMSAADGFLGTLVSATTLESNFDVTLGYSSTEGLHFSGSSTLDVQLPIHISIGPVDITAITLSVGIKGNDFPLSLGANIAASLGPLAAVVEDMGITADFSFRNDRSGNLGPMDFSLGFKPPKGVGLSLDAGVIQGGGFLYIDTDRGEYAGALQLVFADFLGLQAIGLITTKMPDGSSGFSLLIIITADFGPGIQLGFGFTLLAVGGLLGLNRAMLFQPLMDGVRTDSIESIMFPKDIIANATRIISDLRAIFPPQNGTFLIGPMAKLGWGEPTLISLSLGVIIEIPPGDIAILGILKLALPAEDIAVLLVQVNFAGALEFDKKRFYFFASLFDSHVLFITLEGEMGVLMAFGDDANFVVTIGGFHPQFNPPPLPFPSPKRIEIDIINESFARIRCDGYFAVTSNSVQFGAHADMFFGFSAFNVQGHAGLDALFQFSPFHFSASFSVSFSVNVFGFGVYGIGISLTLEGTTPWHAHGSASLSFFLFSVDIGIDFTWGDSRNTMLPPVAVMPILAGEFGKRSNWKAILPKGSNLLVVLRQMDAAESAMVLHPVGTLQVSQRAVPLDMTLDKDGNQQPNDANYFSLDVMGGGLAKTRTLHEQFAAAQFKNMDDAAKLSQQAYVPMDSGIELSAAGNAYASGTAITRNVRYDLTVIDTKLRRVFRRFFVYTGSLFAHFLTGSSVTRSGLSAHRQGQAQPYTQHVAMNPETFAVAFQNNNKAYSAEASSFTSQAAANDYLSRAVAKDATLSGTLHVLPQFEVAA